MGGLPRTLRGWGSSGIRLCLLCPDEKGRAPLHLPQIVLGLSGMFRRSASLAIPHLQSLAAIPSVSLGTRIAAFSCHTNRSVKLPSFRHFQDQFPTTNKEKWGKKNGPVFRSNVCVFDVRGPLASHDSNPYPNRSRIARYNASDCFGGFCWGFRRRGLFPGESSLEIDTPIDPP